MADVIQQRIRVALAPQRAYQYFTDNELLESFFTVKADVEPRVGGSYELDWDPNGPPLQSTAGCRITALSEGRLLASDWKGPPPHSEVMNQTDPLTHVVVAFFPVAGSDPSASEVHVVHSGWGSGEGWAAARDYFDRAWRLVLTALAEQAGAAPNPAAKTARRTHNQPTPDRSME